MTPRQRKAGKLILSGVSLLLVSVVVLFRVGESDWFARWSAPAEYRGPTFERELKARHLRLGMEPAEVERVMGLPANNDRQHVWFWLADGSRLPQGKGWISATDNTDNCSGFLLFVKGRLATDYIRYAEATPWDMYRSVVGGDLQTAKDVLGGGGSE